jgi:hypothetical protein
MSFADYMSGERSRQTVRGAQVFAFLFAEHMQIVSALADAYAQVHGKK